MAEVSEDERYSRFLKAADDVAAAGKSPTLRLVVEAAGGGSMRDVTAAMQLWRAMRSPQVSEVVTPVPDILRMSAEAMWSAAYRTAQDYNQAQTNALAHERVAMQARINEVIELAEKVETERDTGVAQIDGLTRERDALSARVATLEAQLAARDELVETRISELLGKAGNCKGKCGRKRPA